MAVELVAGHSGLSGSYANTDFWYLERVQAVKSANGVTRFDVDSGGSGAVKIGVYADSSGEPGDRLAYNDTPQNIELGANTLNISSHDIASGTYYWLAIAASTSDSVYRTDTGQGGTNRYKAITYATFANPASAGTGFTSSDRLYSMSIWGETTIETGGFLNKNYWWFNLG
jgi:hypothetical protein